MTTRGALLDCVLAAMFAVTLPGCFAPGYPRITKEASGYGDEGGQSSFIIDERGRFRFESKGDAGNGVIVTERCSGKLDRDEVAGLFAAFAEASLVDGQVDHEKGERERGVLTLESKPGQFRSPANVQTYEHLTTQLGMLRQRVNEEGRCRESRSRL
jgi:hypothetical protein